MSPASALLDSRPGQSGIGIPRRAPTNVTGARIPDLPAADKAEKQHVNEHTGDEDCATPFSLSLFIEQTISHNCLYSPLYSSVIHCTNDVRKHILSYTKASTLAFLNQK